MRFSWLLCAVVFSFNIACTSKEKKEELLAQQYCGTCHSLPDPSMLSKDAWRTVMPQMAARMGISISALTRLSEADYPYVMATLPKNPMISEKDFEAIMRYYERESPDSLTLPPDYKTKELTQFDVTTQSLLNIRPTICLVQADTVKKQLWLANRNLMLYKYSYDLKRLDSTEIASPASSVIMDEKSPLVALMGIMDPNDQPKGSVIDFNSGKKLIDSLKRPVHITRSDLNNDKQDDIVVCSFGNYGGALSVYENSNGKYVEHTISTLPGARKVIVKDFSNDGLPDILVLFSQGDENISLYTNAGNFRFRVTTLLKFPPMYGSNYFDIVDFNKDGYWDIIYTNGDNADYSKILKPYHGLRVFLNDGEDHFKEHIFQQLYGCSMAVAKDFDKDGDIDIATLSFFPDYKKTPEKSFVYLENNNGTLEPFTTPKAVEGRWLLMEPVDLDGDGYLDLVLGALDFDDGVTEQINEQWMQNRTDIMVLKNKGKK